MAITQEPQEQLFNSSICRGRDGYVMAYESNDPAYPAFTIKFAQSQDLSTWTQLPDATFGTDRYTACPTIRYADGYYYVFYLEHRTPRWYFETYVTRSADLKTWYRSPLNPVLSPRRIDDGINASDPDLRGVRREDVSLLRGGRPVDLDEHQARDLSGFRWRSSSRPGFPTKEFATRATCPAIRHAHKRQRKPPLPRPVRKQPFPCATVWNGPERPQRA